MANRQHPQDQQSLRQRCASRSSPRLTSLDAEQALGHSQRPQDFRSPQSPHQQQHAGGDRGRHPVYDNRSPRPRLRPTSAPPGFRTLPFARDLDACRPTYAIAPVRHSARAAGASETRLCVWPAAPYRLIIFRRTGLAVQARRHTSAWPLATVSELVQYQCASDRASADLSGRHAPGDFPVWLNSEAAQSARGLTALAAGSLIGTQMTGTFPGAFMGQGVAVAADYALTRASQSMDRRNHDKFGRVWYRQGEWGVGEPDSTHWREDTQNRRQE